MISEGNVLIIDESQQTLAILSNYLNESGYNTYTMQNGELALLSLDVRKPDLIIVNNNIKGLTGCEFCENVVSNKSFSNIPIIFICDSTEIVDKINVYKAGGVDTISHPFIKEELLYKVEHYIHNYKQDEIIQVQALKIEEGKRILEENNQLRNKIDLLNLQIQDLENQYRNLNKEKDKAEEGDNLKTQFLQNISHEIRTPLNSIIGFSGMLNRPDLSEEKRKNFIHIIQDSSNHLLTIIEEVLSISSLETTEQKPSIDQVCLNTLLNELTNNYKAQAQKQKIAFYSKGQLNDLASEIYTDKTKLKQILRNLITNALKFTQIGYVEFGYHLKENNIEFYVKDSGIGIHRDMHQIIFERFKQADKSIQLNYGGTGLGLAISKSYVEFLGGTIWVQSKPEKGSTFYFTIPYKPVHEVDLNIEEDKQEQQGYTVLVAEDEVYNFLFIEEILSELDLKLLHAKNGKESIKMCKANPNINLVLMDIKMAIMDGYDATRIIKEFRPELPIIAQSAYFYEQFQKIYGEDIFNDFITKPIDKDQLLIKIRKYINVQEKVK